MGVILDRNPWKSSKKVVFAESITGNKINILFPKAVTASNLTSMCLLICEMGMIIMHRSCIYCEDSMRQRM